MLVSGAAGAVGQRRRADAKIKGRRAVGVAGGPQKCRWITEDLGFEAAINYEAEDVARELPERVPDDVNVFLDNVGGEILEAVLTRLRAERGWC